MKRTGAVSSPTHVKPLWVRERRFLDTVVSTMESNKAIVKQVLDDQEFQDTVSDFYLRKLYVRLRSEAVSG